MAFDFYFAGTQCKEADDVICALNANVLKSYTNDKKSILDWFKRRDDGWSGRLMIDNGAFTVHRSGGVIDIDKYISWLNENDAYIDYAIALDKIPGRWGTVRTHDDFVTSAKVTWDNYLYMLNKVVSPDKLLPTFHMGESFDFFDRYLHLKNLKYMCLSAFKDTTNKFREDWYEKCFSHVANIEGCDIKFHCLGSATIQNAEKFPFLSMDATSWIMAGANGSILTDYGPICVGRKSSLSNIEWNIVSKILSEYNIDITDVINDYKCRMIVNVKYLYYTSLNTTCVCEPKKKRRLF